MSHLKHSFSPSMRGPYLPIIKGSPLTHYFDYDRFFHSPWEHAFPPVNMTENAKAFQIELMAPGFDKNDFNISLESELLTVSVESKHAVEKKENHSTQKEFEFSSFSRSFHLPANVDEDIEAKYEGGILRITIAKKNITAAKPKKLIEVS